MKYLLLPLLLLTGWNLQAQSAGKAVRAPHIIPGQYLIQLQKDVTPDEFRLAFRAAEGTNIVRLKDVSASRGIFLFEIENEEKDWLPALRQHPLVREVQPEGRVSRRTDTNDPELDEQYYLRKIQAPDAWEFSSGGKLPNGDDIVIAVIDEGFDLDHEDLRDNLWVNKAEIPDNGQDDDGNGKIDDYLGWNLDKKSDKLDLATHGTEVVGIIGARGNNNFGGAGVAYEAKLMLLSNLSLSVSNIIEGYYYIADMRRLYNRTNGTEGAFVVASNSSFGSDTTPCDVFPLWRNAFDTMGRVGILNIVSTTNGDLDVDIQGDMPSTCPTDYILAVTRTDELDNKAPGGYSATSIDMAAPGTNIYSTQPDNVFDNIGGGNSFSCPQVAGAVALLYGLGCDALYDLALNDPAQAPLLIKNILMGTTDPVPDLEGITVSGGRLNVYHAVQEVFNFCDGLKPDEPLSILQIYPNPSANLITFSFSIPENTPYEILIHNSLGQQVLQDTYEPGLFGIRPYEVDIRSWNSGVYFITIRNNRQTESAGFIKM